MTCFASPDIVACPHCQTRYERVRLKSFSTEDERVFSDGGIQGFIRDLIVFVTRCSNCQSIIKDTEQLPQLPPAPALPFYKKWFKAKTIERYPNLPKTGFDVYSELFANEANRGTKREHAILGVRKYHQVYKRKDSNEQAEPLHQQQYHAMTEFLLHEPPQDAQDEYWLICADIYRLRQNFSAARAHYRKISKPHLAPIKQAGLKWCDAENAYLQVITQLLRS